MAQLRSSCNVSDGYLHVWHPSALTDRILENIDHPFIVSLRFAFQTKHKLYMVFGTCCASLLHELAR